jgi:tetratricopeptide (TPR) repeat protein
MSDKQRLLASIVQYLSTDKDEQIQVALQLISSTYPSDVKCEFPLEEIFIQGETVLKQSKPKSLDPVDRDPKFIEFIQVVTQKGFFGQNAVDSDEYKIRYEKAKQKYLSKQEESKKKAEELKEKGNQLLGSQKFDEAIEMYNQAIALYPSAVYHCNLAAAYTQITQDDKAIEHCLKALDLDPNYAKAYGRLAGCYYNTGKYREALSSFQIASKKDPTNQNYKTHIEKIEKMLNKKSPSVTPSFDPSMMSGMLGNMFGGGNGGGAPNMEMFSSLLSDPNFMNMASQILQTPQAQNLVSSMMGGQGGGGSVPPEMIVQLKGSEEYANSEKIRGFVADLESEGMKCVMKYMADAEVQKFIMKLASMNMGGNNPFAKQGGDKEGEGDDEETKNLYM